MISALLELLRQHRGQWLTMAAVRAVLSIGPREIHKEIERLCSIGYEIESAVPFGFRMLGVGECLSTKLIEYGLETVRIGRKVLVYESTDSTNDIAWQYASETGYDGLAVFAEHQRLGRGRLGRGWVSPKGSSILCSVLLLDARDICSQALTLLAGLAVAIAVEKCCSLRCGIRWPNDVMISGRKIAGTMIESRIVSESQCYVVGTGINCQQEQSDFPSDLRDIAVSLRQIVGSEVDRVQLAQELLSQLDMWISEVQAGNIEKLHREWLAYCDDVGRRLTLITAGQEYAGRVIDVNPASGLLLQLDAGVVKAFDSATTSVKK